MAFWFVLVVLFLRLKSLQVKQCDTSDACFAPNLTIMSTASAMAPNTGPKIAIKEDNPPEPTSISSGMIYGFYGKDRNRQNLVDLVGNSAGNFDKIYIFRPEDSSAWDFVICDCTVYDGMDVSVLGDVCDAQARTKIESNNGDGSVGGNRVLIVWDLDVRRCNAIYLDNVQHSLAVRDLFCKGPSIDVGVIVVAPSPETMLVHLQRRVTQFFTCALSSYIPTLLSTIETIGNVGVCTPVDDLDATTVIPGMILGCFGSKIKDQNLVELVERSSRNYDNVYVFRPDNCTAWDSVSDRYTVVNGMDDNMIKKISDAQMKLAKDPLCSTGPRPILVVWDLDVRQSKSEQLKASQLSNGVRNIFINGPFLNMGFCFRAPSPKTLHCNLRAQSSHVFQC
jgi:hypothetical protein